MKGLSMNYKQFEKQFDKALQETPVEEIIKFFENRGYEFEDIEGGAEKIPLDAVVSQLGSDGSGRPKIMGGAYFDYDAKDDILHIHFGQPIACKTIEVGEHIYIRKTPQGKLSAIEIWNYKKQLAGE